MFRDRRRLTRLALLAILTFPALLAPAVTRAQDNAGFLYGRVVSSSGTEYRGFLRWGKQEAFWDDLFHSAKEDLPFRDEVDEEQLGDTRRGRVRVLGFKIEWEDDGSASRVFIARFGDIERIEVTGDNDARLTMKGGERYDVSGYADDVGGEIQVRDSSLGEIDLRWDRIEIIEFMPAPRDADPGVTRLYGVVETDEGDFEGYVMWDKEECVSTDLLDGESEDGDLSIEMGRIRSIERRGRSSSIVELEDGRSLRLRGSNDVDDDNRGIMVEVDGLGKVTVTWDAFDRVEFRPAPGSGRGYEDYTGQGPLRGSLIDEEDREVSGRLVFDLDESETWEILNGSWRDLEFDIPLLYVEEIEPTGREESRITLRGGRTLELRNGQDVSDRNDGVLVYEDGQSPAVYVPWDEIRLLRLRP